MDVVAVMDLAQVVEAVALLGVGQGVTAASGSRGSNAVLSASACPPSQSRARQLSRHATLESLHTEDRTSTGTTGPTSRSLLTHK
jgi:hypothetical protein